MPLDDYVWKGIWNYSGAITTAFHNAHLAMSLKSGRSCFAQ